ncbi:hypothetical protein HYZ82_00400 [Candidatus Nomurabacteria bacterium]|nr:hypothetical protein [Candidatus Nomurabacteria bacterium]
MACKMIMDGVRDPEKVAEVLQTIVDEAAEVKVYLRRLFGNQHVAIYELVANATFVQMFGEVGGSRHRWKDKDTAVEFARQNLDKLGPNANFFELENGSVVYLLVYDGGELDVGMDPLSNDNVWRAECQHRVLVPKLAVSPSFIWRSFLFSIFF